MTILWDNILNFWFDKKNQKKWFLKDSAFDDLIKLKYKSHVEKALSGQYDFWNKNFNSRLSLILLLDQMTRNIFRNSPKAFSGDEIALSLSMNAINEKQINYENDIKRRIFLLMPLMHSEDINVQNLSIKFFKNFTDKKSLTYAQKHKEIIFKFGRFPHRNQILGRPSTDEEKRFLNIKFSSFYI